MSTRSKEIVSDIEDDLNEYDSGDNPDDFITLDSGNELEDAADNADEGAVNAERSDEEAT